MHGERIEGKGALIHSSCAWHVEGGDGSRGGLVHIAKKFCWGHGSRESGVCAWGLGGRSVPRLCRPAPPLGSSCREQPDGCERTRQTEACTFFDKRHRHGSQALRSLLCTCTPPLRPSERTSVPLQGPSHRMRSTQLADDHKTSNIGVPPIPSHLPSLSLLPPSPFVRQPSSPSRGPQPHHETCTFRLPCLV